MKTCTWCKQQKPESEFYKRKKLEAELNSHCKKCANERSAKWRKANPGKGVESTVRWQQKHRELFLEQQRYYAARRARRAKMFDLDPASPGYRQEVLSIFQPYIDRHEQKNEQWSLDRITKELETLI